jgi:hypothetical protein
MKLASRPLVLLISAFSGFVNATDDDYDVAIRQVMNGNGLIGSAVAFYDGVSGCDLLVVLSYHSICNSPTKASALHSRIRTIS